MLKIMVARRPGTRQVMGDTIDDILKIFKGGSSAPTTSSDRSLYILQTIKRGEDVISRISALSDKALAAQTLQALAGINVVRRTREMRADMESGAQTDRTYEKAQQVNDELEQGKWEALVTALERGDKPAAAAIIDQTIWKRLGWGTGIVVGGSLAAWGLFELFRKMRK